MMMETATKMAVHNKTQYIIRKATGRGRQNFAPVQSGFRMAARLSGLR